MPTYVLEGAGRAVFPRRPIVVSMTVVGPVASATIRALVNGVDDSRVVRPTPGLLVLPRVDAPTVLRLMPAGPAEFPPDTTVHLTLAVEDRSDPDPDRAVLGPIDVSGLTHIDVAALESVGEGISVAALRGGREIELGPVANQARVATRAVLGVDQLPEHAQADIAIAVDMSASMLPAFADGSVAAVVDVISGIASVVAPHRRIRLCLADASPRWLEIEDLATASAVVTAEVVNVVLVSGFQSAAVSQLDGSAADMVTFILTDAVPADSNGLAYDTRDSRHIVTIQTPFDGQEAMPNVTIVAPPPPGASALERLVRDRDAVNAAVRSMLNATTLGGRGHAVVTR
ncbi:hypothetical protein [Antrihabitans stalactiti]|uniref:Uncharacterized protein n=1 Tax=Antrihabitans stalactiti TaxID=2584121 RepID=A0A848KBJ2_9NOCA|nr:hypothetical protein [Antrihabitans stalactiti]NMN95066.1 hypothetical protein [Antrihabitans stalactiti]